MSAPDLETKSRRLFAGTCELLGLDPKQLTLGQKIRVSRASALRLQIDDLEKAQLLGQPIDINKLCEASEALERLVNATGSASKNFEKQKAEFARLLNLQLNAAGEYEEIHKRPNLREENAQLREANANILEENARLKAQLKELSTAKPSPRPPDNVMPLPKSRLEEANTTKPPEHYLAEHRHRNEPWCDYIYGHK
jgi:predicted nuclease with TOPRIM domain